MEWKEFCKIAGWGEDPSQDISLLVSEVTKDLKRPVVYTELLAHLLNSKFKGSNNKKVIANDVNTTLFAILMKSVETKRAVKISGPDIVAAYQQTISNTNEESVYKWLRDSLRKDIENAYNTVGIKFVIGPNVYFFCSSADAKALKVSNGSVAPIANHFIMWLYKQKNRGKHFTEAHR